MLHSQQSDFSGLMHRYKCPCWVSHLGILIYQRSQHNHCCFSCRCGDKLIPFVLYIKIHLLILPQRICDFRQLSNTDTLVYISLRGWVCLQALYQPDLWSTRDPKEKSPSVKSKPAEKTFGAHWIIVAKRAKQDSLIVLSVRLPYLILNPRNHRFGCFCKFSKRLTVSCDWS